MTFFADRRDAGRRLAAELGSVPGREVVVLGLPRGGVPVAYEVATALHAALDVIMVRKLGVPGHAELAMGALGEDGTVALDQDVLSAVAVSDVALRAVQAREQELLQAQVARLRSGRARLELTGTTAVVVDDGIATGSTMRVACRIARRLGAARVIAAAPVAARGAIARLDEADQVVCVSVPARFLAVGAHYADFAPTCDREVVELLEANAALRLERG